MRFNASIKEQHVITSHEHIRFRIVITQESRNPLKKRGETEKPYE